MTYQRHSRAIEFRLQQLAIAWEEYLEEKARAREEGRPHSVTMTTIALRHGMKPNQLAEYHANHHYERKP